VNKAALDLLKAPPSSIPAAPPKGGAASRPLRERTP
jgi:hypothetical protein